ncbi:MAG: helix-turn-helix transcriptional regulator [Ruminococcus sp.]|nr:helix-turn-helix transcriptional regulator [Ruminococcus sp.]
MITFGEKLKHLRTKKYLTQKQLGLLLGFCESCANIRIAQYESGNRTPKEETMKKLTKELGIPLEILTTPILSEPAEYSAISLCF